MDGVDWFGSVVVEVVLIVEVVAVGEVFVDEQVVARPAVGKSAAGMVSPEVEASRLWGWTSQCGRSCDVWKGSAVGSGLIVREDRQY